MPQLPQDVRDLADAPFPVRWSPVVALVELSAGLHAGPLKDTLRRKELVRTLLVNDLVARLDPEGQLAEDMRPAQEEHVTGGGSYETFV
jgi:hypothetical protein